MTGLFKSAQTPSYATFIATDPTGQGHVLARNPPMTGGRFNLIPSTHELFLAKPPLGHYQVRTLMTTG